MLPTICWNAWYLVGSATIADRVASFYEQLLFIWKSTAFTRGALDRGTYGLPLALNWWTAALNKTRGSTKHHLVGCRTVSSIQQFLWYAYESSREFKGGLTFSSVTSMLMSEFILLYKIWQLIRTEADKINCISIVFILADGLLY